MKIRFEKPGTYEEELSSSMLEWVHAAGNPYFDYLFGDPAQTTRVLDERIRRPSSEISLTRASILRIDSEAAGGFIALNGKELRKARTADTVALAKIRDVRLKSELIQRMKKCSELFSDSDPEGFYLSKMGLNLSFRSRGLAHELVKAFVEEGRAQGYRRYRLHVAADNDRAIRCYQRIGFTIQQTRQSQDGVLTYHAMTYERNIDK